jgi:hypothetical protein
VAENTWIFNGKTFVSPSIRCVEWLRNE